ncbi:calcium-activated potassium channel subunit beta-4 [Acanthochromis polyacanthus]|uniref:Potassium calcium-activated channel subfamily M regulatory beta subunit 4 n=1 Tax=Acanthochromis polyacanthus TaxID=80966 RepID=A0A3Q1FF30_9TELE|nr:calcium-activated potassium channel subunit beta-4 [Acanthochromis polyacanthus]
MKRNQEGGQEDEEENRRNQKPPVPLQENSASSSSIPRCSSSSPCRRSGAVRGAAMAKIRVSYEYSEAEDKSIRLGLFLIACGILSLFILGFCWLSPTLQSLQSKPANCTVVSVLRPEEMFECVFTCGADCKGTSLYPCLQIFVNNSESNSVALLHFDEQQLVLNPKCSYVPPCERDNQKNKDSVLWWEDYFTREVSSQSFTCFFNQQRRPDDVLWRRSHDTSVLLHCVLWPMVSLLLGTLIVLLTVCARSLAVRAEALQKRKCSYEVCQDLSAAMPSDRRGNMARDPLTTNSDDPELLSPSRTLPLFAVPIRRRDREH